jgi:hypothetical protein
VPATIFSKKVCYAIANDAVGVMRRIDDNAPVSGNHSGEMTSSKELLFSGRIYIYDEYPILKSEEEELLPYFKQKNLDVIFRGDSYARETSNTLPDKELKP